MSAVIIYRTFTMPIYSSHFICSRAARLELSGQLGKHKKVCLFTQLDREMRGHTGDVVNQAKRGPLEKRRPRILQPQSFAVVNIFDFIMDINE